MTKLHNVKSNDNVFQVDEKPAIIVTVKPPENVCFIAMPFEKKYNDIFAEIQDACNSLKYIAKRMDKGRSKVQAIPELFDKIKNSKLNIVVIPDEGNINNPNVMYELGLSHAWGKPTLLIYFTSELPSQLPFNIATKQALKLERNAENITDKIQVAMMHLLEKQRENKKNYIDPDWRDYDVYETNSVRHFLLQEEARLSLRYIFNLMISFQRQIVPLFYHLDGLFKEYTFAMRCLSDNDELLPDTYDKISDRQISYTRCHNIARNGILLKLKKDSNDTDKSFNDLLNCYESQNAKAYISILIDKYNKINESIERLEELHDNSFEENNLIEMLEKKELKAKDIIPLYEMAKIIEIDIQGKCTWIISRLFDIVD
ncbi:MAG: hypothetical protein D3910_09565 [Candidatus Electrothrix sp. ATG2]|nr:hypothetical protein [Candidatus Electrothrix sp. ATG2]